MKKIVALVLLTVLFKVSLKAQKDTSFWFAAPDIEIVNHPIYGEYDRPIYMRLTSFTSPATVTVSIPANPAFVPIIVNIPANSTYTVNLTTWIDLIENSNPANVANKGIYIQSTSDITAYYEINSTTCNCNPELLALKGRNALGNEFYVPSQLTWAVDTVRHPNARAGFDLVATQNNTTVTITPAKALIGHAAGVPFTIILNKGQSYACIALYRNGGSMLNGSKVAADKPIAISTYEDVLFSDGACADLAADQLVPTNIFGTEFAVVRGDLAVRDKVIITASQSNTSIYLNGNAAPVATINAGQSYEYDLLPATPVLYITTSKPAGVYHYTGSGCEVGAAAIPKLTCTGSTSVSLVRTSNGGNASVMLVTKAANQGNFLVNGVAGIITGADFAPVPGSGGVYVYAKKDVTASMPLNVATTFSNTTGKFQLGFFNMTASNGGCMYGFFSDFKKSNVSSTQLEICRLDSTQLNASGGVTYLWSPATGLSNPNISNPKASPAVTTDYKVVITDGDGCVDSAFVKVVVNVCSSSCNSSFEFSKSNNGKVGIVPAASSTFNQLYNSNGFSWETWFKLNGPVTNLSTLVSTEDAVLFHDIFLGFGWGTIPNALCFLVSDNGSNNATVVAESLQSLTVGTWYHVAAVCDYPNAQLKLYLNGNVIATKPIPSGILNDRLTTNVSTQIGNASSSLIYGVDANIDETRFWNTVRSQAEIQASMNQCLSNPQAGLVAYFKADELAGSTANSAVNNNFSGQLLNTTWGVQTPGVNCGCASSSSIINTYTPVLSLNPCTNTLTVEDASTFNTGDTVLLIQMKGAIIDSTNTAAFGTITDYKNAGNYEFNYVKSKTGNQIELLNNLTRQYDIPAGKVQLVRVPYYTNLTTADTLTCLPWDGNKGGVLVFNVQNTLTLNQPLDVSGKGFKGAPGYNPGNASLTCNQNSYNYPTNTLFAAQKGESITTISNNIICGKGSPAGGGGGGLGHNSGGGGGGNAGTGGFGGYQLDNCGGAPFDNRGIGGKQLLYSTALNRVFLGSGGGAGHADNPGNIPPAGGNGAGIIIVNADKLLSNGKKIIANGNPGLACSTASSPDCHDAMGGGGAGGTVLLSVNQYLDNSIVENKGGKGADVVSGNIAAAGRIGPGGGGAGGLAFLKAASIPANLSILNTGGLNGVLTQSANDPWGATSGSAGQNLFNLVLPIDNTPFKPNIDSVRIKDSLLNCNDFDFKGFGYVNTNPVASWHWYFGDGSEAFTQNTTHAYASAGLYTVKLVIIDINGCTDSITKNVNALPAVTAEAGPNQSFCSNGTVTVTLNGTAVGGPYLWSPAIYLNNPTLPNPVATINTTTTFYLNVIGSATCTAIDSVIITINPVPLVDTRPDTSICRSSALVLTTNSNATSYQWTPAGAVNNPTIASPNFIGSTSGWVYVTGSFTSGCTAIDSLYVTILPTPLIDTRPDTSICLSAPLVLTTSSDATSYQWSPAASVSNPTIASPAYIGSTSGWVFVTGSFASGCSAKDSLFVTVNPLPLVDTRTDTTICFSSPLVLSTNSNATIFQWSPAGSVNNPAIASPNYIGNTSGWVYVTGSTAAGCQSKDSLYVTVNPLPNVQTIADTTLCQNQNVTLITTGAQSYTWSPAIGLSNPNISNPVFIGSTGQTYTVTGTDINGCKNTDVVIVDVILPYLFKEPPSLIMCEEKSVQLNGNNGNQVNYLWTPAAYLSNNTIINPLANPPVTTLYTLLVTDKRCSSYDSLFNVLVTVQPAPVINAGKSNDIDCAFQSATLYASGGNQYIWSPSTGLSNPTIPNPVATPANDQTYIVFVTDAIGCTNTDTVTVFNKKAASLARYMPNAFTPDGNGRNDCFGLKNWMYIQRLQFFIFNRYGEQVFATTSTNGCWDGTYKGKPALAGTYVYYIKAQTDCGLEEQKGTFLLIR